jgi:hypothetical protein
MNCTDVVRGPEVDQPMVCGSGVGICATRVLAGAGTVMVADGMVCVWCCVCVTVLNSVAIAVSVTIRGGRCSCSIGRYCERNYVSASSYRSRDRKRKGRDERGDQPAIHGHVEARVP